MSQISLREHGLRRLNFDKTCHGNARLVASHKKTLSA